jgi:hypothetical protein
MRSPGSTPRLVPEFDLAVHIVLDDFGTAGRVHRETDEERARLETVVDDFLSGQFNRPLRVVAFNTAEGWSRDVSEDVAWEVLRRATEEGRTLPASTHSFVEFHVGEDETLRVQAGLA